MIFPKTQNTNQIGSLKPKTLLKTCFKHFRNQKFFSLKILAKNPKRWGLYRPNTKLAVRAELAALTGNGRPARSTANGQKYDHWATAVDRPGRPKQTESRSLIPGRPARSTETTREQSCSLSVDRLVDQPTGLQTCTCLCTSVDRIGRPASGAVDRLGRPTKPVSLNLG